MNENEAQGVLTIALLAALADGRTGAEEREQVRSLFESLSAEYDLPSLSGLQQRAVLKQVTVDDAASLLTSEDARRMAFEIAVCVADADGKTSDAEQAFLDTLETKLSIAHDEAVDFENRAYELVDEDDAPLDAPGAESVLAPAAVATPAPTPAPAPAPKADPLSEEVDKIVLKYAILNGALELLPQNLATMAILPLQTRMVYAIGKRYGHTLGAGHIKEFIATLGLGATSQMLENFARKALGKLAKKTLGKTAGKVVKTATGPLMTFASTYAIGKVAKAYYAGGRTLAAVDLRAMFQRDLAEGKVLYERHRPEIERNASTLDAGKVMNLVRGQRLV